MKKPKSRETDRKRKENSDGLPRPLQIIKKPRKNTIPSMFSKIFYNGAMNRSMENAIKPLFNSSAFPFGRIIVANLKFKDFISCLRVCSVWHRDLDKLEYWKLAIFSLRADLTSCSCFTIEIAGILNKVKFINAFLESNLWNLGLHVVREQALKALVSAVKFGHFDVAQMFVNKLPSDILTDSTFLTGHCDEAKENAWTMAAKKGHYEILELFLDNLPKEKMVLNEQNEHVLCNVALSEHMEILKLLFQKMEIEVTTVHWALNHHWILDTSEIFKIIIEKVPPNVFLKRVHINNALELAVRICPVEIVEMILNSLDRMPLVELANVLIQQLHETPSFKRNYLNFLPQLAEMLVRKLPGKILMEIKDPDSGDTALHWLARGGLYEERKLVQMIDLLLNKTSQEAMVAVNEDGDSPLHCALKSWQPGIAKLLIAKLSPEALALPDQEGYAAFHIASALGYDDIVKLLIGKLSKEALSQRVNSSEATALHLAAEKCQEGVVEILLKHLPIEAPTWLDKFCRTPLDLAKEYQPYCQSDSHSNVVKLLNDRM